MKKHHQWTTPLLALLVGAMLLALPVEAQTMEINIAGVRIAAPVPFQTLANFLGTGLSGTFMPGTTTAVTGSPVVARQADLPISAYQSTAFLISSPDPNSDYLANVCKAGLVKRWSYAQLPLKVYVSNGAGVSDFRPEMYDLLKLAFSEWSKASGSKLTFMEVSSPEQADIECYFAADRSGLPDRSSHELGQTITAFDGNDCLTHATVFILTTNQEGPYRGSAFNNAEIFDTALHEVGHALGLNGHSENPLDIMYFTANQQRASIPTLTNRDVNTLNKLYAINN